jgi:hypothetical protein
MSAEMLAQLIADLENDDFETRENASKELSNLGRLAEEALRKAMDGKPSAEAKRRVKNLLDQLSRSEHDPVQLQFLRSIEVLERIATPEAQQLIEMVAKESGSSNGEREAQTALERLKKAK